MTAPTRRGWLPSKSGVVGIVVGLLLLFLFQDLIILTLTVVNGVVVLTLLFMLSSDERIGRLQQWIVRFRAWRHRPR